MLAFTKKFTRVAKRYFISGFEDISKYSNQSKKEILFYCLGYLIPIFRPRTSKPTLNFLITSKAEVRVFSPILKRITENATSKAVVVILGAYGFPEELENAIRKAKNLTKTKSIFPLIHSCMKTKNWANVICLDHNQNHKEHAAGVEIIKRINASGGKTVCLQHGSIRKDNIEGHKTSESKFQVVWGAKIYQSLIQDLRFNESNIFLEGNPLHDELYTLNSKAINNKLERYLQKVGNPCFGKKIILLATCLHSEYENRESPTDLYRQYIRRIYQNIDFENYLLIVKMHPMDSVDTNLYIEQLNSKYTRDVLILEPDDNTFSTYELIKIATLVVTRASTVAEESLMIGKNVLAYDLFKDGPSADLEFLSNIPQFEVCAGMDAKLALQIKKMCEFQQIDEEINQNLIRNITHKFDGNSTERVLNRLNEIARNG